MINRTVMNLLLKVSRFFHDLQVNVLLTKIFLVLESFVNYLQTSGNRRILFNSLLQFSSRILLIGTSIFTIKAF